MFLYIIFVLFIAVNEVHNKQLQISWNLINFHGKIRIFKELQVPISNFSTFQGGQGPARAMKYEM